MGRKKGREGREKERRKGHGGKEGISFLELCKTREEDHVSKWLRPSSLPERWDHIYFHGSNRFTPATLSHQTKKTRRRACLWSDTPGVTLCHVTHSAPRLQHECLDLSQAIF